MVWSYLSPQVWYGREALEVLFERISTDDRVTIVTDPNVEELEFFNHLISRLNSITRSVRIFDGVNSTPDPATIKECVDLLIQSQPSWVIGVGGGSVLDTAKTAHLLCENPQLRLDLRDGILFQRNFQRRNARSILVAIPTTAGTGSEATCGMMVKDPNTDDLCLVASYHALADHAILDPQWIVSLPNDVLACTAMDALGQSIEAYTSNLKNDFSDGHALVSIKLIFRWLRKAYSNPADIEAKMKLQNAACLSGLAWGNAPGGLAHALAEAFSPHFGFHHGRAVGIFLPYAMEFNSRDSSCCSLYAEIAHFLGIEGDESEKVRALIARIRALKQAVRLPASIRLAGISKAQWESFFNHIVHRTLEDGIMKNRRSFGSEDAARILRCAWNGRHIHF
jgi:alcohol dehydrogenase class IV